MNCLIPFFRKFYFEVLDIYLLVLVQFYLVVNFVDVLFLIRCVINVVVLMADLKIHIEESLKHPLGERRTVMRNTIPYYENISFPYEKVMSVFKLLYPNKSLIFNFTII